MSLDSTLEYVWDKAVGGLEWLKEVVLGEFDDHRQTSAIVADMLASFVPGVVIVTSARDLTAVVIRMVKHPEKREEVMEWMLVIGCAIPLILPVLAAAAGAAAAGVGAIVGGIGGSEAGAALRAVCLLLIEHGGEMLETLIKFLRRFVKGDVLAVLRDINFTKYAEPLTRYIRKFIDGLLAVTRKVAAELAHFTWFESVQIAIKRLEALERGFYEVQRAAIHHIPGALGELQARLTKALAQESKALQHSATPTVHAPRPRVIPVESRRVHAMPGNPLGHPHGVEPGRELPHGPGEQTNLHEQRVEREVPKMEEERLPCFKADKLTPPMRSEMDRQLAGQQQGLNGMTVQEYLDGRAAYQVNGRGDPSVARTARTNYQADLNRQLQDQYIEEGATQAEAAQRASQESARAMSTLAALHNPDQVAGGANNITDFGDRTVNSTIGGQWASNVPQVGQSRVQSLDAAARTVPVAERSTTMMNAKLERCK